MVEELRQPVLMTDDLVVQGAGPESAGPADERRHAPPLGIVLLAATRRTALLAALIGEDQAFGRDAVDVRRGGSHDMSPFPTAAATALRLRFVGAETVSI